MLDPIKFGLFSTFTGVVASGAPSLVNPIASEDLELSIYENMNSEGGVYSTEVIKEVKTIEKTLWVNEKNYKVFKRSCDKKDTTFFKDCYAVQDLTRVVYDANVKESDWLEYDLRDRDSTRVTVPVLKMSEGKWYVVDKEDYKYIKVSTQDSNIWIWTKWNENLLKKYGLPKPEKEDSLENSRSYFLGGLVDKRR